MGQIAGAYAIVLVVAQLAVIAASVRRGTFQALRLGDQEQRVAALRADGVPAIEGVLRKGLLCPPEEPQRLEAQRALVQILSSIRGIKARDMGLARAWVDHLRAAFETAFSEGYVAVDCLYEDGKSTYVLEREG